MNLWQSALLLGSLAVPVSGGGQTAVAASSGWPFDRIVMLSEGRKIALRCSGRGRFTVLLEPGDGGRRTHMAALFTSLSARYRVCDYDRRNVGRSSAAALPRKGADLTSDLFDALSAADVHRPYILFGSSMGGLLVRSYATSRDIAGFVASNQPGTAREWRRLAFPIMTASQQARDAAWMAGDNNEHVDVNDVSRAVDDVTPPSVPYVIMVSTERFQCREAGICGNLYSAYVAASRQTARAGPKGRLRILDGDHDLYVTHLKQVGAAIDHVASAASVRR
jgi:pimeloyl-ACP methyl ester carboxylesterase